MMMGDDTAGLSRRRLLERGAGLALLAATPAAAATGRLRPRVRPADAAWPSAADWRALGDAVGGRLEPVAAPSASAAELANPFWLRDQPGLPQISGWIDAWRAAPGAYAVRAQSAADVSAAVRFAAAHNLRLAVRGGGHSYMGGSCAPDSLLVWLRPMDRIESHEAFTPAGAPGPGVPAVSVGGGAIWLHAYEEATGRLGRYVQGGGCTTVGVGGHVTGAGFGSFSKRYGTSAASLLEAEVVTADGRVRIVNEAREPDLFWALKGGGGGTFGVVTRFTLATHDLPPTFGAVRWSVQATSDEAHRRLLQRFLEVYADRLFDDHWGEQAHATGHNGLEIEMVFQGLDAAAARGAWTPLTEFVRDNLKDYQVRAPFLVLPIPARLFWNADALSTVPGVIVRDRRPGARPGDYWNAGDGDQAGGFWYGYASAWLPARLLKGEGPARLAAAWFEASRHRTVSLHFNKGLAGGSPGALQASRTTSQNPEVLDAFALAIMGGLGPTAYGAGPGPDLEAARDAAKATRRADEALRQACPGAGCYLSECDFFLQDWKRGPWGENYERLARIKRRHDPDGLFTVHHGVGSDGWSEDGFTPA